MADEMRRGFEDRHTRQLNILGDLIEKIRDMKSRLPDFTEDARNSNHYAAISKVKSGQLLRHQEDSRPSSYRRDAIHGLRQQTSDDSNISLQDAFYFSCPNLIQNIDKRKKELLQAGIVPFPAFGKSDAHKAAQKHSTNKKSTIKTFSQSIPSSCPTCGQSSSERATRRTPTSGSYPRSGPSSSTDPVMFRKKAKVKFNPRILVDENSDTCSDMSLEQPFRGKAAHRKRCQKIEKKVKNILNTRPMDYPLRAKVYSWIVHREAKKGYLNWEQQEFVLPE